MALLSDFKIEEAKIKEKEYTLKDGDRLFLNIHPNGSKYWLFRFSWNGKQTRMSFGVYPSADIKKARHLYTEARNKLSNGTDPRLAKNGTDVKSIVSDPTNKISFAELWLTFKLKKLNARPSREKRITAEVVQKYCHDNN
ncbi:Arm DNA-binding domain-containing protein [Gilliamella sp. Gris1-4]|uniref:Arm DNA-binding domain-containing protein n=1 Tax=Gilliamella sp. Gris1-4 TaxID=3120244 RepID=UPI00080D8EE5|nr:Arm DNA-binding domain-containing protein [Gilliamella apicola]OCG38773.1 hypothetical protein A9G31_01330 [Gilliamella apicola]OCG68559.1 hypothetical protein A9G39_02320 [Gilliamella apicola]